MSIIYDITKANGTRVQCIQAGQTTTYIRNGNPGIIPVVIGTQSGGANITCLVHPAVLGQKIPTLRPMLNHILQNPGLLSNHAIQFFSHPRPIMLRYMIDALYSGSYMAHQHFDQQGLIQALNGNPLNFHIDMYRVARRAIFDRVAEEAKNYLIMFINGIGQSPVSTPGFIEALGWLYSNLVTEDWDIQGLLCYWLASGLRAFKQPMRDDIIRASQTIPLFKSDLKRVLDQVAQFNVPGFTI